MTSRAEIFALVKQHLPGQKCTGRGITWTILHKKLEMIGILAVDDHGCFPIGIREIDMMIMSFVPDEGLKFAGGVNKYLADIYQNSQLWRDRLSAHFDHKFSAMPNETLSFRRVYQKVMVHAPLDQLSIAAALGHLELVEVIYRRLGTAAVQARKSIALQCAAVVQARKFSTILHFPVTVQARNFCALQFAATNGHLAIVAFIVAVGTPDLEELSYSLGLAAEQGNLAIVEFLFAKGASLLRGEDHDPLEQAAYNGCIDVVRFLVDRGVDIHRSRALPSAAKKGFLEVVKYLAERDAPIKANTFVAEVVRRGHFDVLNYLVSKGIFEDPSLLKEAIDNAACYNQPKISRGSRAPRQFRCVDLSGEQRYI